MNFSQNMKLTETERLDYLKLRDTALTKIVNMNYECNQGAFILKNLDNLETDLFRLNIGFNNKNNEDEVNDEIIMYFYIWNKANPQKHYYAAMTHQSINKDDIDVNTNKEFMSLEVYSNLDDNLLEYFRCIDELFLETV